MDLDATIADPRAKLVELGRAVARAATIDDVIRVARRRRRAPGERRQRDGAAARRVAGRSSSSTTDLRPAPQPCGSSTSPIPTPAAEVVRTGQPVFVASLDELCDALSRASSSSSSGWTGPRSPCCRCSRAASCSASSCTDGWSPVEFTPERRELIETISELVGHALARARNHDHLVAYTRRLRDSNRDLDSFAAAVAHDLRQPLRQLSSYIDVLFDHLHADQFDDDADALRRAHPCRRRAGRPPDRRPARLRPRRRQADGRRRGGARRRRPRRASRRCACASTRSARRCASGSCPTVQGDPALLHQVLQNLIDNAAKYQRPGPTGRDRRVGRAEEGAGDDGTPWWRISVARQRHRHRRRARRRRCSTCSPGPSRAPS